MARNLLLKLDKAITLFHTQAYKEADSIADFQALFLDSNEMMSKFIEFYCKSAEDRSGRLNDQMEETRIFEAIMGRPPITPEDKQYINKNISPFVHQYSASQGNTEQNSGARGKKISAEVFPHLPVKSEKKHAKLAKEIFKGKKLEPTPAFREKIAVLAF